MHLSSMKRSLAVVVFLAAGTLSGRGFAQEGSSEDVPPVSDARSGLYAVKRGLQGEAGLFHARVLLHINLSDGAVGKPVSIAPDLFYAVTDKLQLGLLHNGPMGWQTRPGAGLCLTGKENGCREVYDNVGFDALYGLVFSDDVHLSAHASFYIGQISDPTLVFFTIGAAGKIHFSDSWALFFDPQIGIGLNNRDLGNKERLFLPIELQWQASPPLMLSFVYGIEGQFDGFSDNYIFPVGLGGIYSVTANIDLGARFSFDNLLGAEIEGVGRADLRSLALFFRYRQ